MYSPVFSFSILLLSYTYFFNCYSVSNFKSFTDLQEISSVMRENNSVFQEHTLPFVLALHKFFYLPWHSIFIATGQFQV